MSPLRRALALVAALAALAVPTMAQTMAPSGALDGKLRSLEQAVESGRAETRRLDDQTTVLTGEIADLRARAVVLARSVQDRESALDAIEQRTQALEAREADLAATEARRRQAMAAALGGLLRIARRPPEAVLAMPLSLGEALHARMILAAAVPALDADARRLNGQRATLSDTRARLADERTKLATAWAALTAERRDIDRLLSTKARLERRLLDEKHRRDEHLATIAAEARSLRDLVARLAAGAPPPPTGKPAEAETTVAATPTVGARPAEPQLAALADTTPPPPRSFADARGTLPLPARGRVVGRFGQSDADGERAQGIRIATRPGAQVITPYDGRVVFAGVFRGLGLLLIIDHGEGYHSLLAGLSRIDPVVGQWLLAGEPVGVMGDAAGNTQVLYVELRQGGEAINPLPWLAASERKASG